MRDVVETVMRRASESDAAPELLSYFEDLYDHVLRAAEWTESLRDMVASVFETNIALATPASTSSCSKLTAWAAIVAVPTAITGYFGQNVPFPGFGTRIGFAISLLLIIGLLYRVVGRVQAQGVVVNLGQERQHHVFTMSRYAPFLTVVVLSAVTPVLPHSITPNYAWWGTAIAFIALMVGDSATSARSGRRRTGSTRSRRCCCSRRSMRLRCADGNCACRVQPAHRPARRVVRAVRTSCATCGSPSSAAHSPCSCRC